MQRFVGPFDKRCERDLLRTLTQLVTNTHATCYSHSRSLLLTLALASPLRPVVVVVDLSYKLTRRYPHEGQDTLNSLLNPMSVLPRGSVLGGVKEGIELVNPESDYIPPELIELMVTNVGTWKPSYVYRLLQDAFCEADPVHFEVGTD